ncbi:MAG: hypothetical protein C0467_22925 [Planctomycetaceae bacterium]|nr:hypothetical protein [Planctomycetaceae bacterium]
MFIGVETEGTPVSHPNLRVDSSQTGPRSFFAADYTDSRFQIEASLRTVGSENVLSFIVVAELLDGTRGRVRGSEFFTAMMDHFGNDAVDVIEGQWEDTNPEWVTNLKAFNRVLGTTSVTLPDAATLTPTGIYATRRGYTTVSVARAKPEEARGHYTAVLVEFRRN